MIRPAVRTSPRVAKQGFPEALFWADSTRRARDASHCARQLGDVPQLVSAASWAVSADWAHKRAASEVSVGHFDVAAGLAWGFAGRAGPIINAGTTGVDEECAAVRTARQHAEAGVGHHEDSCVGKVECQSLV